MTFQELLDEYFLARVLRPSSQVSYRQAVKHLQAHIELQPEELDRHSLLRWRKQVLDNGLSPTSFNTYLRHLKVLFNFAIQEKLLPQTENPFRLMTIRQPSRLKKTLSPYQIAQARAWLDELNYRETITGERSSAHPAWFWRVVFETFYYTGIRLNQLVHLRSKDIQVHAGYIVIRAEGSKTWREYAVPIVAELDPWLRLLKTRALACGINSEEQVFNVNRFSSFRHGKQMSSMQVTSCFNRISKRLCFRITPHRFRHTLATDLMRFPDRNLHAVRQLLGHTDLRSTLEYISTDMNVLREILSQRTPVSRIFPPTILSSDKRFDR